VRVLIITMTTNFLILDSEGVISKLMSAVPIAIHRCATMTERGGTLAFLHEAIAKLGLDDSYAEYVHSMVSGESPSDALDAAVEFLGEANAGSSAELGAFRSSLWDHLHAAGLELATVAPDESYSVHIEQPAGSSADPVDARSASKAEAYPVHAGPAATPEASTKPQDDVVPEPDESPFPAPERVCGKAARDDDASQLAAEPQAAVAETSAIKTANEKAARKVAAARAAKEAAETTAAAALAARAAKKAAKTSAEPQAAAAAPGRALSAEELALKDATLALARRGGSGRREERMPEINNHRGVELKVPARPNACAHSTIPTLMEPC
jgi:hypothetical protein